MCASSAGCCYADTCPCCSNHHGWLSHVKAWTETSSLFTSEGLSGLLYPLVAIAPTQPKFVIAITGYTGTHRSVLQMLTEKSGAQCTDSISSINTHLICATHESAKARFAKEKKIELVNHLWLMDSILAWTWQPCDKYRCTGAEILDTKIYTLLDTSTWGSKWTLDNLHTHQKRHKVFFVCISAPADICYPMLTYQLDGAC